MIPVRGQGHGKGFLSPAAQTRQRRQARSEKHDTAMTDENRNKRKTRLLPCPRVVFDATDVYLILRSKFVFEISPLFFKAAKQTVMLTLSNAADDAVGRSAATFSQASPPKWSLQAEPLALEQQGVWEKV